jgi:predicted methyltransferase
VKAKFALFAFVACAAVVANAEHQGQSNQNLDEASIERQAEMDVVFSSAARSDQNKARDKYRHPVETLDFFEVDSADTVVELWPGGGWYTEILAPYLALRGKLYVVPPAGNYDERIRKKLASNVDYGKVQVATFTTGKPTSIASGSTDVVLTFRNVHSWLEDDAPIAGEVFAEAFRILKPGGTLGLVQHRLPETASSEREKSSGYVKVSTVRRLAEQAGFKLAASSEVNANPKDTADHPEGVWTLPPTLELGDKDREKYLAIGESDRMTLKFVKPR